ncbi:MAG: ATP synthase subunit I [Gammaproteobacteria bacterium]
MRIIAVQVGVGLTIAASLFLLKGWNEAYSALAGALVGVLPSYYLGNRITGCTGTASGDVMLKQIYVAEMMKLGMTVALFLITIFLLDAKFSIVVSTYAAVVSVNWLAMRFTGLHERTASEQAPVQSNNAS